MWKTGITTGSSGKCALLQHLRLGRIAGRVHLIRIRQQHKIIGLSPNTLFQPYIDFTVRDSIRRTELRLVLELVHSVEYQHLEIIDGRFVGDGEGACTGTRITGNVDTQTDIYIVLRRRPVRAFIRFAGKNGKQAGSQTQRLPKDSKGGS